MYKKKIKIYGERNTGTNYLHQLIGLNYDIILMPGVVPRYIKILGLGTELAKDFYFEKTFSKNLGWKHSMVIPDRLYETTVYLEEIMFITLTKNPYSWLLSLYRRPYHSVRNYSSFSDFLSSPWKTVGRDNYVKEFLNPIDMWNKKNASYLLFKNNLSVMNLRYEELIYNPFEILTKTAQYMNLIRKYNKLKNVVRSTKDSNKNFRYYQEYYLKEKWKNNLKDQEIEIINDSLDEKTMNHFSYKILK